MSDKSQATGAAINQSHTNIISQLNHKPALMFTIQDLQHSVKNYYELNLSFIRDGTKLKSFPNVTCMTLK